MKVDLLHNKIVKETITESFTKSISENLIPKLFEQYGNSLVGIQMYEDYTKDNFIKDGYMYYPLSVSLNEVNSIVWIKWNISDKKQFKNGNPYAYLGDKIIDFQIVKDIPEAFEEAISGRVCYYEGGLVKTEISTDAADINVIVGKYSQVFVDELSRQITKAISKACGVRGLAESSIEINVVLASNTYMEHTSENVTYRRLLISAKGCAPRDFWVKWTRLNSSSAFTITDNVNSDNIRFEIGEDVSHKIREKEYRFLVYGNSDKYRVAMGRKNITEWRELIKRSLKRGELEKTTTELEEEAHVSEVSDKLSEILEKCGVAVPAATVESVSHTDADMASEALRNAVLAEDDYSENEEKPNVENTVSSGDADDEFEFDENNSDFELPLPEDEEIESALDEAFSDFEDDSEEDEEYEDTSEECRQDDELNTFESEEEFGEESEEKIEESENESEEIDAEEEVSYAEDESEAEAQYAPEEDSSEKERLGDEISRLSEEIAIERRRAESERMAREDAEESLNEEKINVSDLRAQIEKQRAAIAEIKALLERETGAKKLAEAEATRLRAENENTVRENDRLAYAAKSAEDACREAEQKSRESEERLLMQIELYEKQKVREKLLVAEAARQVREELERELSVGNIEDGDDYVSYDEDTAAEESSVSEYEDESESKEERLAAAKEKAYELRLQMEEAARREAELKLGEEADAYDELSAEEDAEEVIAEEAEDNIDASEDADEISEAAIFDAETGIPEEAAEEVCENTDICESENVDECEEASPIGADSVRMIGNRKYVSKVVRILFGNTIDQSMKPKIREMMTHALTQFGKSDLYMKVKATIPDENTLVLDFIEYPENEMQLLIDIIHYLGNGNLGIYKIILD